MNDLTLTAGQALVRLLANYGVQTVFGIPGVHTWSCTAACRAAVSAMCLPATSRAPVSWQTAMRG